MAPNQKFPPNEGFPTLRRGLEIRSNRQSGGNPGKGIHARSSRSYRRAFIVDFRLRIRANDPNESRRLFDQQNHSVFLFDQSQ